MWNVKKYARQSSRRAFAKEEIEQNVDEKDENNYEYREDCPEMMFVNAEDYIQRKLRMLREDMWIEPTEEELEHLHSLNTRGAIDSAVHSIIDRHWDDEC